MLRLYNTETTWWLVQKLDFVVEVFASVTWLAFETSQIDIESH